jgi:hypothetical protein
MSASRITLLIVSVLLAAAACTPSDAADTRAAEDAALRRELAATRETARVASDSARAAAARNGALLDSISKLEFRIARMEVDRAREDARPPSVAGTWSDGRRTLRINEDGTYSIMDPTGAFQGHWQLDHASRRLDLSPPLGSRISGRVAEDWGSIAVEFQAGSRTPSQWVLNRQE